MSSSSFGSLYLDGTQARALHLTAEDGAADYEESAMEQEGHEGAPHDEDTTIIDGQCIA